MPWHYARYVRKLLPPPSRSGPWRFRPNYRISILSGTRLHCHGSAGAAIDEFDRVLRASAVRTGRRASIPWCSAPCAQDAELMFVGRGPGAEEDEQGEPFVAGPGSC
jgi:hypothetical protein